MPDLADLLRRGRAAARPAAAGLRAAARPAAGGLRAAARALRDGDAPATNADADAGVVDPDVDWTDWLLATDDGTLADLDRRAGATGELTYADFRGLDDDVWAMLLSQRQTAFPRLAAFLPAMPDRVLQQLWNGASGARLSTQTIAFARRLRDRVATHGATPLHEARVLDHGIGWGRIARHLARDAGELHGTDPAQMILDRCAADRVPATLHKTDFLPVTLPVADVDVAYAFSVFTHTSERATAVNLAALHAAIVPGGLLIATIRPPAYADLVPGLDRPDGAEHVFHPHPADPSHPQYDGGEMTYGEAIVALDHVRERWAPRFELLDAAPTVADPHQVVLTLRRAG